MMQKSLTTYVAIVCFMCFICLVRILQVFHVDVAKVDQDILFVCCISNERFECSMQHEVNVAAGFFLIINC